jgi:AraC-like DNA-binding protein
MGEMADMYAELATCIPDWMTDGPDGHGPNNRFDDFRDDLWVLKDGTTISIRKMSDQHLLAAFKMFGDDRFKDEMLIRMFETFTKPRIGL